MVCIHKVSSLNYLYIPSADLNTFIRQLDERYDQKIKKQGMLMAKKVREVGTDGKRWSIDKEWEEGKLKLSVIHP